MEITPQPLDEHTFVLYLEVPGSKVVLLQGFFELYEGVGTVRTLDIRRSLLCILTTRTMLADCIKILHEISSHVPWRPAVDVSESMQERYLGYFKEAEDAKSVS
jgi:hypothetical protein